MDTKLNNQATTRDWIIASKDLQISAYPRFQGAESDSLTKNIHEKAYTFDWKGEARRLFHEFEESWRALADL